MFWFNVCPFFRVGVPALTMTFQGGPGCSSFDGLMMEIGPWRMDKEGVLRTVEGGWEEYMTMVYGTFQVNVTSPQLHLLWIISRPACWYRLIIYQYESLCAQSRRGMEAFVLFEGKVVTAQLGRPQPSLSNSFVHSTRSSPNTFQPTYVCKWQLYYFLTLRV